MADLDVLGIAGSLRAGSFNRALLRAAAELAPPGMRVRAFEGLREIPPYDGDLEASAFPAAATALKYAVASAGAVLVCTPEYNHSIPGVLKNAIDHGSRPHGQSAWAGKPAGVIGVSPGATGCSVSGSMTSTRKWSSLMCSPFRSRHSPETPGPMTSERP